MPNEQDLQGNNQAFEMVLGTAAKLPIVHVNREDFLKKQFLKKVSLEQLQDILDRGAPAAGVPFEIIDKVAKDCINACAASVTAISTAAGLPGGFAMAATIPADIAQFFGHTLHIAQKLAYLYGWPDLFDGGEEMDDGTKNMMTLFVGVMFGVAAASNAVTKIASRLALNVPKQLVKKALTKGTIYPIVKKVAAQLGVKMTKDMFAKGVGKAIPVVGGVVSGGLTVATFLPMASKLQKHLSRDAKNIANGIFADPESDDFDEMEPEPMPAGEKLKGYVSGLGRDVKSRAKEMPKLLEKRKQATSHFSAADEILKFKQLLDAGIITQDEFDTKKRQLIG